MVQIFSFAQIASFLMSAAILFVAIAAIVATVKAEMPFILRALGIEPRSTIPPLRDGRPARVVRQARLAPPAPGLRAVA